VATRRAGELSRHELQLAALDLEDKIATLKPGVLAFLGKAAFAMPARRMSIGAGNHQVLQRSPYGSKMRAALAIGARCGPDGMKSKP